MYEKPYYFDPFANAAQQPPNGTTPVPPGQAADGTGNAYPPYEQNGGNYAQNQFGQQPQPNNNPPPQGTPYPYGTGYNNGGFGFAPYGAPQAPVLGEKAMEQMKQATLERQDLVKKGNVAGALLLFYFLFAMVFGFLIQRSSATASLYAGSSTFQNATYIFYSIFCLGGATWLACHRSCKASARPIIAAKKVSLKDTAIYVVVGFVLCMAANLVTTLIINLFSLIGIESTPPVSPPVNTVFGVILVLVSTAVIPALVEECAFRGAVLQPLRNHGEKTAILLSALLFGLLHGNLQQIPFAFMVGLVLGFITVKTGSILPAILLHFVNNANSIMIDFIQDKYGMDTANKIFYLIVGGAIVVAIVIVMLTYLRGRGDLFRLNAEKDPRIDNPFALTMGKKMKAFLTAPCMIIAWIGIAFQVVTSLELTWFR